MKKEGIVYRAQGMHFRYQGWPTVVRDENENLYVACSGYRSSQIQTKKNVILGGKSGSAIAAVFINLAKYDSFFDMWLKKLLKCGIIFKNKIRCLEYEIYREQMRELRYRLCHIRVCRRYRNCSL